MTPDQLEKRRKRLGLSRKALAEKLNTTENTLYRNEQPVGSKNHSPIQNPVMLDLALQTLERQQKNANK